MSVRAPSRPFSSAGSASRTGTSLDVIRGLAAAGVLLSAVVHLDLWDLQNFRTIHIIGPLFLLNVIAGIVIGVVVLAWRHWLPALAAAGFGATTLIFFWWSVLWGLFGLKETATGSAQVLAEAADIAALVFGLAAAYLAFRSRRS